jgi:hypothetical protein
MENNIISIASKFNQEHGRAMTWREALEFPTDGYDYGRDYAASIYAESVRQFERTKVIEEVKRTLGQVASWDYQRIMPGIVKRIDALKYKDNGQ